MRTMYLTPQNRRVLKAIEALGHSPFLPSIRDVAKEVGRSRAAVHTHVVALRLAKCLLANAGHYGLVITETGRREARK